VEIKRQRILVTGGAGFIGSHLVDRLCVDNEVIVFDDLSTGLLENLRKSKSQITLIIGDILNYELLNKSMKGVDIVYHLAAHVGINEFTKIDVKVNIQGTVNILEVCRGTGVKRIVFASSAGVYGESDDKLNEGHSLKPLSVYGMSKLKAEKQCMLYHRVYDIPVVILRYFNVYGQRASNGDVVSSLIKSAEQGMRFIVYGDGKQTRDFVYVEDVVKANILAATKDVIGEVFNVGTGVGIGILPLFDIVKTISGVGMEIVFNDARRGDTKHSVADITKSIEMLGYQPSCDVLEGLVRMWNTRR